MLCALMKNMILSQVKRRLTSAKQGNRFGMMNSQTHQQTLQPLQLTSDSGYRSILCFRRRTRNCALLFSLRRVWRLSQENNPICQGTTSDRTGSPIIITPTLKGQSTIGSRGARRRRSCPREPFKYVANALFNLTHAHCNQRNAIFLQHPSPPSLLKHFSSL